MWRPSKCSLLLSHTCILKCIWQSLQLQQDNHLLFDLKIIMQYLREILHKNTSQWSDQIPYINSESSNQSKGSLRIYYSRPKIHLNQIYKP
ncbi:unnamed protein product [Paramecium octaurelia]|uniref:Uncharacterized protein n=1 Tax=Paramecium octaurelia TaxID=43137 RepID=A0A8S1VKI5_PAROT|nr:unnamed protein product [Paramecium octaurelia]